jgi:hypothetical protein
MEHPLINDVGNLTEEELHQKVNELTKKYMTAQRLGNASLCNQIGMALETYRNKLQEKYRQQHTNDDDFDGKIDVS